MMPASEPPLCVDLDGTLIEGDTLMISVRHLARRAPWVLLALPFVLLRGRALLKAYLAARYVPDPALLTWRADVVDFVRQERSRGRKVILATAAHRLIAEAVMKHLGLFDALVATEGRANAKGQGKAAQIRKSLKHNDFDYIGDSAADLPVFRAARLSYLVAPTDSLRRAVRGVATIAGEFPRHTAPAAAGPSPAGRDV